jgi:hypothetical protein
MENGKGNEAEGFDATIKATRKRPPNSQNILILKPAIGRRVQELDKEQRKSFKKIIKAF